ncbi:MAG: hypothetical protein WCL50_04315 [Spirochaetota bacterium]
MTSLYEELSGKIALDPRLTRRSGPRQDLGLLLFAEREAIDELWKAAERCARGGEPADLARLGEAVEGLRAIFGERGGPSATGRPTGSR